MSVSFLDNSGLAYLWGKIKALIPTRLSSFTDDLGTNPEHTHSQYLTSTDISGKADKVNDATNNNFAALNASGNLKDSGKKASDFAAASHTHNYAGSSTAGGAANQVKSNLVIKLNGGSNEGTNQFTYNGSTAKTVNINRSGLDAAASSHTHGNLQNNGTLQTLDVDIVDGDQLVVTDINNSKKVARASVTFDGTTTDKALTKKGTFETFLTSHQDISGKADKGNIGYYECSIAGSTAAKTVNASNYVRQLGGSVKIKFLNVNTADNATLSIGTEDAYPLFYNGARASSANSWKQNEVVSVYFDGTYYQASNARGSAELKDSLAVPSQASHSEGVTEYVVSGLKGTNADSKDVLTLYGLKADINDIRASSASTSMGLASGSTVRFIAASDTIQIVSGCSTTCEMTLTGTGIATPVVVTGTTSGTSFYQMVTPTTAHTRTYNTAYSVGSVRSRSLSVSYVGHIFYGTLPESQSYESAAALVADLTTYGTAKQSALGTYSGNPESGEGMVFDSTRKKIYIVIEKNAGISNINPAAVYWQSLVGSNNIAMTQLFSSDNNYLVYVSQNSYEITTSSPNGESRNIIFNSTVVN